MSIYLTNFPNNYVGSRVTKIVEVDLINCVQILTSHIEVDHIPDHENGAEDVAEKEQKHDCQKRVDMVLIRIEYIFYIS